MLSFKVIDKCYQKASYYKENDVDFLLEEDNWNDYFYKTLYHLHVTGKLTNKATEYLGEIKIMKFGQTTDEANLLGALFGDRIFNKVPEEFCSLSFSIDLYKAVAHYLKEDERKEFIESLHLILDENSIWYNMAKDDDCFKTSLLRGGNMDSFELQEGRRLLLQEGNQYDIATKEIKIRYTDSDNTLSLRFRTVASEHADRFQDNVIAFIGKNGSGKSTALYKLASLLYTNPSNRYLLKDSIGTIEPLDLGIAQLMIFSYTPFDNFTLPGADSKSDLKLWAQNIEDRTGRFIYCGLRDVTREALAMVERFTEKEMMADGKVGDDIIVNEMQYSERSDKIILKNPERLSEESYKAFYDACSDKSTNELLDKFVNDLKKNCPEIIFSLGELDNDYPWTDKDKWMSQYNSLSTGHKFFIHSMLHIIAYCESNALLMFDEPENHLQSPLLSYMMHLIKEILKERHSVMLIATHSPVILQELMSDNVRIVSRNQGRVSFRQPIVETFGGEIGEISSEVFGLNTDRMYFFDKLDKIYSLLDCRSSENVESAVATVKKCLGSVSCQAVHYIVSRYLRDNCGNVEN